MREKKCGCGNEDGESPIYVRGIIWFVVFFQNMEIEESEASDSSTDDNDSFIPRSYQIQMMEIAIKQNTIIYLPTGSGKTFIAILVLKHLSRDLNRFVLF